ncbi:hypothetical protein HY68_36270 [Streptomyces sp. AcH 505]|nr:hypothetical protein HY68_36270 [Streptomyces sp. AcH 505]
MAEALREHLGGPLHPPTGSTVALSDAAWARIEHLPHPSVEQAADLPYERQEAARLAVVEAELAAFELADALIGELQTFWPDLTHMYGGNVGREVAAHVGSVAVGRRRDDRQYLGTLCALIPWCAISVAPWYQMATAGGLVHSVEQFVTWLGDHPAARALDLIAEEGFWLQGVLSHAGMAVGWNSATAMVATAVAHCAIEVPEALHGDIIRVLRGLMVAPGLTEPMADLLLRLDGNALQTLGPDVAPGIDERLSLPEGTTARVLPALVAQLGVSAGDALREMAWRSAKRPPTVATPDRSALSGLAGVNMRVVSTLLIEAGYLAPPPGLRPGVYEDITRSLLTACQATDLDEGM